MVVQSILHLWKWLLVIQLTPLFHKSVSPTLSWSEFDYCMHLKWASRLQQMHTQACANLSRYTSFSITMHMFGFQHKILHKSIKNMATTNEMQIIGKHKTVRQQTAITELVLSFYRFQRQVLPERAALCTESACKQESTCCDLFIEWFLHWLYQYLHVFTWYCLYPAWSIIVLNGISTILLHVPSDELKHGWE